MEDLKFGSEQPGSIVAGSDGTYYQNIHELLFQLSPSSTTTDRGTPLDPQQPPMILGISRLWFMVACGAVIFVFGGWFIVALVFGRSRQQAMQRRRITASSRARSISLSPHESRRESKDSFARRRSMSIESLPIPLYSDPSDRGERSQSLNSHASRRENKNSFGRSRTLSTERRLSPLYSEPFDTGGDLSRSLNSHASRLKNKNSFERSRSMSIENLPSALYSEPTDRPDMVISQMVGRQRTRPLVGRSTSSSPERHATNNTSSERPVPVRRKSSRDSAGRSSLDVPQNNRHAVLSTSERTNRRYKPTGDAGVRSASSSRLQGQAMNPREDTVTGRMERQKVKRELSGASTSNLATKMDRELPVDRHLRHASMEKSSRDNREQSASSRSDQSTRVHKEPVKQSLGKGTMVGREQRLNRPRGLEPIGRSLSPKMKLSASANKERAMAMDNDANNAGQTTKSTKLLLSSNPVNFTWMFLPPKKDQPCTHTLSLDAPCLNVEYWNTSCHPMVVKQTNSKEWVSVMKCTHSPATNAILFIDTILST